MERSPMIIDRWDSKNDHVTKSDLQIQYNPHQNSNTFFFFLQIFKDQFSTSYENKTKQNKTNKHMIAKTILNNWRAFEGITITDLKLYYRAIVIKLPDIGTEIDKLINGIELDSEINPNTNGHLN